MVCEGTTCAEYYIGIWPGGDGGEGGGEVFFFAELASYANASC